MNPRDRRLGALAQALAPVTPTPVRDTYTDTPEFPPVAGAAPGNDMNFHGRHIFVIGGSRGIGASCVEMLARRGAAVSFTYASNRIAAEQLESSVKAEGVGTAAGYQADVVSQEEMEVAMTAAVAAVGKPLDGLVCSVGVFEATPVAEWNTPYQGHEGTEEDFRRTMEINVMGTILAVRAAINSWADSGGSMVIITSTAGQRGSDIYSAYATSKGAQLMFMRSMAKELAPQRTRVNCVAPGWTETDMAKSNPDFFEHLDEIAESIPLGRPGLPEDVGAAVSFLLSDLAPFITGSTITVDGGFDMRG